MKKCQFLLLVTLLVFLVTSCSLILAAGYYIASVMSVNCLQNFNQYLKLMALSNVIEEKFNPFLH